ncbi:MAG TPA: diguanylate cyclase [Mycobacteriales bacterium]|nr:diguanylate cyclase [Mycobacteriales bacterium]
MRIIVADDDLGSRLVAQAAVESLGHQCVTVADGLAAWALIQQSPPEVLVTDRAMPGLDGVELCRRVRAAEQDGYTYIILLTAYGDPADVLSGMLAGADDYVTKPLNPIALEARLLAAARVTELHAALAETRAELAKQAHTDPLTGLSNRLGLAADLQQVHNISERYDRSYCVAICDVDYFKRFNDIYGHLAGDQALRTVAATLAAQVRDADRVYRIGGEEFLVLLPEQSVEGGRVAVERIRGRLEDLAVAHVGSELGLLTVSVGLAGSSPAHRLATSDLLAQADAALYDAKREGRNRVVVAAQLVTP